MSKISGNMHLAIIWAIILFLQINVKIAHCDGIKAPSKELCPCLPRTICPRAYGMSAIVSSIENRKKSQFSFFHCFYWFFFFKYRFGY